MFGRAVVVAVALSGLVAGSAGAQERTIVASGVGLEAVKRPAQLNEASITTAVEAADRAAEAKAVKVAQAKAASYAANTGQTLGALLTVDEGDLGIFGSLSLIDDDDEDATPPYCRVRSRYDRAKRRSVRKRTCVVPSEPRSAIVRLTYAAG